MDSVKAAWAVNQQLGSVASVDLLNYENICDNEYLMRILSNDGNKDKGESGSPEKGSSQAGVNATNGSASNNASGSSSSSTANDTSFEKLEMYVRHLFQSSSENSNDEGGQKERSSRIRMKNIGEHGDATGNWVTSGNTPEEIVIYGNEIRLGKQAINDRFSSEIYSLAKTQDSLSSLIYRQVIVVEYIWKSIAGKISLPRVLPKLTNGAREGDGKTKEVEGRFVEDAVVCALRVLEQQSRRGVQDIAAVEPLISLVLRVLRASASMSQGSLGGGGHAKEGSQTGPAQDALLSGSRRTVSRSHFAFMRAILCNAFADLADYSPKVEGGSRYSHAERAEKLKACLCSAYGLLAMGACSGDVGDIVVALSDLTTLCTLLEQWREDVAVLLHAEEEEALAQSGDGSSRKLGPVAGAAERPLSGHKKELIEKSMSKQKPVHDPTSDVPAAALAAPHPVLMGAKGERRPSGGNNKGLKVDTSSGALDQEPDVPAADTPSNASLYEKDARSSPAPFNENKARFFPGPSKDQLPTTQNNQKDLLPVGAKDSRGSMGAAKVVLDKDYKMRVRRVVEGQTQSRVPGKGVAGLTTVMSAAYSADSDAAYTRSLHEVQTKSLLKTLRSLGRVPQSVLQIIREASLDMNARASAARAKESKRGKPLWDARAPSGTTAAADSGTPGAAQPEEPRHYVWAVGQNSYGELGLGDTSQRSRFTELPSQLYLDNKIVSLGAGNEHSVFVTEGGKLFVVGYNENGQCGLGNTQQARGPHALYALENEDVAQVHVHNGCEHTLAVTREGKLYSFGYNYRGQLGLGSTTSEVTPQLVRSLASRRVVSASSSYHHSLILCDDGSLFSVGRNDCGQLGHGDCIDKKAPVQVSVPGGEQIVTMSCGQFHSVLGCASGAAFSCGKNDYGQLGLDTSENAKVLTRLPAFLEGALVQQVCCGYYHTLVLLIDGTLVGFGRNDYGQLGLGHTQPRVNGFHVVSSLSNKSISSVAAGCYHTIAVSSNGMLYVFGRNNHGQLGTGDLGERHVPFPVDSFLGRRIVQVAAGFYHTLVLAADAGAGGGAVAADSACLGASDALTASAGSSVRKVDTRVSPVGDAPDLAFDDFFFGCMRARMNRRASSAVNQHAAPDAGTTAITAALRELSIPAVHFSVHSSAGRSKVSLQSLLPFLVDMLRAALRNAKSMPHEGDSGVWGEMGGTEASTTTWAIFRELSWLARQLRALAALLSMARQACASGCPGDCPFLPADARGLLDALLDASVHVLHNHGAALLHFSQCEDETSIGQHQQDQEQEQEAEAEAGSGDDSSSRQPPAGPPPMPTFPDVHTHTGAGQASARVHERCSSFFASAEETEGSQPPAGGVAGEDRPRESGALRAELASLLRESVDQLRQELLNVYYAVPEGAPAAAGEDTPPFSAPGVPSAKTEPKAEESQGKLAVSKTLQCISRFFGVLHCPPGTCRQLLALVEAHLASPPGVESLRSALLGLALHAPGSVEEALTDTETDSGVADLSKHLRLFSCVCARFAHLGCAVDLFQASPLEGVQVAEKVFLVYSQLVGLCGGARGAVASAASADGSAKGPACALHQECLKAVRAAEGCLSNLVKCVVAIAFTTPEPEPEPEQKQLGPDSAAAVLLRNKRVRAGKVPATRLLNRILLAAAARVRDFASNAKAAGAADSASGAGPAGGVLLPIIAPFVLASAVSCPDVHLAEGMLAAAKELLTSLLKCGYVEMDLVADPAGSSAGLAPSAAETGARREREAQLPSAWWSRLLKLGVLLYAQRSCGVTPAPPPPRGAEGGVPHLGPEIEGIMESQRRDALWRYIAFPEDPSFLAQPHPSVDPSIVSLSTELRQREMITNHAYRLLHQQSVRSSLSGKGVGTDKDGGSAAAAAARAGLENVKGIIERVESLLLAMLVHVDGPGLTQFLPLSQRKQQQQPSLSLIGKQGNKRLCRMWASVARVTRHIFSKRSRLCALSDGALTWPQILSRIADAVSRCHAFFLAGRPLILYSISALPCEASHLRLAPDSLPQAGVNVNPGGGTDQQRDTSQARARAAFKRCVNCVICLIRWRAVTRARGGSLGGAVTKFVIRILDLSAEAIASPATFIARHAPSTSTSTLSLAPAPAPAPMPVPVPVPSTAVAVASACSPEAQDLVWARLVQRLAQGTVQTERFADGLGRVNALLAEARLNVVRVDLMVYMSIALRAIEPDFLDSNLPYDAVPGLCVSQGAFERKKSALRQLETFIVSIILDLHTAYCSSSGGAGDAGHTDDASAEGMTTAEAGELMVAAKLLHFLCTTTRTCARVLPATLRPEILSDLLLRLVEGGGAPETGAASASAPPAVTRSNSAGLEVDSKGGNNAGSNAATSTATPSVLPSTSTSAAAAAGGGSGASSTASASAAAAAAKKSGSSKERSRVVRRACHALVSLVQDLGASLNPTIHTDSQTLGNQLLSCHSSLVARLQRSRLRATRNDSDPLQGAGRGGDGLGRDRGAKAGLDNKKRSQELIRAPLEFCRSQEGLVVQGDKLLNNYKGMDFTLAMWLMPTARSSSRYCFVSGKISHNDAWPLISLRNDGKIVVIYGHGNEFERVTSQSSVPLGAWTHISVVVEPKKIKLFVNGAVDSQVGTKGNGRAILYPVVVGTCPAGLRSRVEHIREGFDGMLAQYKYYTRALSPIHVRVIFDQGPPESFDVKERWVLKLLTSCRLLLHSCGGLVRPDVLSQLAASTHLVYVSEEGQRLRGAALLVLRDIFRLGASAGMTLSLSSSSLTPTGSPLEPARATRALADVVPAECATFEEGVVLYLLRTIGVCWLPASLVSPDHSPDHPTSGAGMGPDGRDREDLQRGVVGEGGASSDDGDAMDSSTSAVPAPAAEAKEAKEDEPSPEDRGEAPATGAFDCFLDHAPAFLSNRQDRPGSASANPSSSLAGDGGADSDFSMGAASERSRGRLEQALEVSDLCCSLLGDLATLPRWQAAVQSCAGHIARAYSSAQAASQGDSRGEDKHRVSSSVSVPVATSADVLGLSIFVGQPHFGVSGGAQVRHYFSNSPCRVLGATKTSGQVTLLSWNDSTSMYQLIHTHQAYIYSSGGASAPALPSALRLSMAPHLTSLLSGLQASVAPLLTDHFSVQKFEHPLIREGLLRSVRPLDVFCFALMLKSIAADPGSVQSVLDAGRRAGGVEAPNALIGMLSEAAFRLQSTVAAPEHKMKARKAAERSLLSRWDAMRAHLALCPAVPAAGEGSTADSTAFSVEEQVHDYLYRSLHISPETFKSPAGGDAEPGHTNSEGLLASGKFSSLIQKFALASSQGFHADTRTPSMGAASTSSGTMNTGLLDLFFAGGDTGGELPSSDGEGDRRDAEASGVFFRRGFVAASAVPVGEADVSKALEVLFDLRRMIVADCRQVEQSIVGAQTPTRPDSPSTVASASWHASLWDALTTVPRSVDYADYLRRIRTLTHGLSLPVRLEFTHALASALRYVAGPIFSSGSGHQGFSSSSSSELSCDLLDGTDILSTLVHAMSTWVDLHMGVGTYREQCEVCTACLRLLLPALTFVEQAAVEAKLLRVCRTCLDFLVVKALSGAKMTHLALGLAKGSNFTLLRARAQDRLGSVTGEMRYAFKAEDCDLLQLAVGMEIFQKAVTRHGLLGDGDSDGPKKDSVDEEKGGEGGADTRGESEAGTEDSTSKDKAAPSVSPLPAGRHTGPPRVVGVTSCSVDVDLADCVQRASPLPHGCTMPEEGRRDGLSSLHLVEVALGVAVDGEETIFQTVYCGNSYRFVESSLTSDCRYQLRCRLLLANSASAATATAAEGAEQVQYSWSEAVNFQTDIGVPFVFDTTRRGSDILVSEDGLSASYAGDDCWSTALGNRSFSTGVTTWEISVAQSSTAYIFVGVATSEVELNSFLGGCANGWGFIGEQSLYHNREKVKVYGEPFGAGDIVGVTLDLDKCTLSFTRNGSPLGVAFNDIHGELFPAVAFYNMGQELEIVRESFHTTCPQEPIPCSPDRFNMHDLVVATEMLQCMEHRLPFSWRLLGFIADECNTWCSCLQRMHTSVNGRAVLLDQKGPMLEKYGLVVGERVRTTSGVAVVAGTAMQRLWFSMESREEGGSSAKEPRVWFFSSQQIELGRRKGLFKRCTYEPEMTPDMNSTAGNVIHVPDTATQHTPRLGGVGSPGSSAAPFSPSPLSTPGSVPASPSPHRAIINDNTPNRRRSSRRAGARLLSSSATGTPSSPQKRESQREGMDTTAFDAAAMADLANNLHWTEAMDAALIAHFQTIAAKEGYASVWEVSAFDLETDFRALQSTLSRLVMEGEERVSNKWGFRGPKRRAVVARMATLRVLNFLLGHNIVVLTPSRDLHGRELGAPSKFAEKFEPRAVSLTVVGDGGSTSGEQQHPQQQSDNFALHVHGLEPLDAEGFADAPHMHFSWETADETDASATESSRSTDEPPPLPLPQFTSHRRPPLRQTPPGQSLPSRGRVFLDLKQKYFSESVVKSATKPSKTEDDYDYPDDLPQVRINRIRSFRAREIADLHGVPGEDLVSSSMFYQLWTELRGQALEKLRISYTHPMDDGQCRAFKIRFDAEGVDDYGGPYREIFQQICDELQASDPSASANRSALKGSGANSALANRGGTNSATVGAAGLDSSMSLEESFDSLSLAGTAGGPIEPPRHPDKCLLPLLMPTPNWTAGECSERYKYIFNIASRSDLHMDLFRFMGQMLGLAVRSKISVDIAFPSVVWKYVARQTLTEQDIASFDIHAYQFTQHLASIHNRMRTASSASERGLISQEAQGILQDLTWSAVLSDGSVVDLMEEGRTRPVRLDELGAYLSAYTSARLQEAAPAMEAFRKGLVSVIPESAVTFLPWEELQCLVCGANTIDIERLRQNTEYDEDISPEDAHIKMFWSVLSEFSEQEKSAFLRFVWARPSLPPKGAPFPQKFKVQGCASAEEGKSQPEQHLPRAHTCFFSINLPKYPTEEMMARKIRYAIFNCTEMDADFRLTDTAVAGWSVAEPEPARPVPVD